MAEPGAPSQIPVCASGSGPVLHASILLPFKRTVTAGAISSDTEAPPWNLPWHGSSPHTAAWATTLRSPRATVSQRTDAPSQD